MTTLSESLFNKARSVFPGGVNSPVRAFHSVGGTPPFIQRGEGPFVFDVDGNRYVDYVLSWGPLILGHAHPMVVEAIQKVSAKGTSFGMPTEHSLRLAERIKESIPGMEMLRFVNSGTEATMSALRLARAFTGRNKIIKFEGCYHGHADFLLVKAGSGVATLGLPDSPGVTPSNVTDTLVASYNDVASVQRLIDQFGDDLAAVIVEPVAGNMGMIPPAEGFLAGLKELCRQCGALLIFDEVMTGFRVGPGSAQGLFQVEPDLTTLGKVIGGGLPVGAYGGKREIMEQVAPVGPVYQAGTLSGNPLAMAAGLATLDHLMSDNHWECLHEIGKKLDDGIRDAAEKSGVKVAMNRIGTMSGLFFLDRLPSNWNEVSKTRKPQFNTFFHSMLSQGVFLAPSPFEVAFISTAHHSGAIDHTIQAARVAFEAVAQQHPSC